MSAHRRVLWLSVAAVFALAVVMRTASCGESLWVDELHTAWTISGSWQDIAPRAALGNQTPWYFYAMWMWQIVAGDSEFALRLPSVLASASTAAVLVVAVTHCGGGSGAGVLAGVLMALERNAIFFGTEARVYAWVMLVVALAGWASVAWVRDGSRRWRWVLAACVLAGLMLHITTGLVLVVLVACAVMAPSQGLTVADRIRLGVDVAAAGLVALVSTAPIIRNTWNSRARWHAFGRTESLWDLWSMWPWTWTFVLPCVLWAGWRFVGPSYRSIRPAPSTLQVLLAAAAATVLAWVIAKVEIAAIWHRRYIIGVLPLVCWFGGAWWSTLARTVRVAFRPAQVVSLSQTVGESRWIIGVLGVAMAFGLLWSQDTLQGVASGGWTPVQRGERWRAAAGYITRHRRAGDRVLVAAELIESDWLDNPAGETALGDARRAYLTYPVLGPYRVEGAVPLGPLDVDSTLRHLLRELHPTVPAEETPATWILIRRPVGGYPDLLQSVRRSAPVGTRIEALPFGRLSVLRVKGLATSPAGGRDRPLGPG